jgi:chromosome segregation and condensation protein ScpB
MFAKEDLVIVAPTVPVTVKQLRDFMETQGLQPFSVELAEQLMNQQYKEDPGILELIDDEWVLMCLLEADWHLCSSAVFTR